MRFAASSRLGVLKAYPYLLLIREGDRSSRKYLSPEGKGFYSIRCE
jgi:hypothetical protein